MNPALPHHIAIIMDGNGRWAAQRSLPRIAGHRAGVEAVRRTVEGCARIGIDFLTLFAFSRENWNRPEDEVRGLMLLLDQYLKAELKTLMDNNIRLKTVGRTQQLPASVQKTLREAVERSSENKGLTLTLALSYSGKDDILKAAQRFALAVREGKMEPESLDAGGFSSFLDTVGIPDPDLLVRTSGEMRISNFMLWQIAYSEFFVTDKLWPDFTEEDLQEAIRAYGSRERRFGLTSEQIRGEGS